MFIRNVNMTFSHSVCISRIDGYEEKYLKKKSWPRIGRMSGRSILADLDMI